MESNAKNGRMETWQVRAHGRVQGVGYRDACVRRAQVLGVTGWVRNRVDGSVEATLQGSPERLENMCHWLRVGVPAARVDRLEVTPVRAPSVPIDGFNRLPTA